MTNFLLKNSLYFCTGQHSNTEEEQNKTKEMNLYELPSIYKDIIDSASLGGYYKDFFADFFTVNVFQNISTFLLLICFFVSYLRMICHSDNLKKLEKVGKIFENQTRGTNNGKKQFPLLDVCFLLSFIAGVSSFIMIIVYVILLSVYKISELEETIDMIFFKIFFYFSVFIIALRVILVLFFGQTYLEKILLCFANEINSKDIESFFVILSPLIILCFVSLFQFNKYLNKFFKQEFEKMKNNQSSNKEPVQEQPVQITTDSLSNNKEEEKTQTDEIDQTNENRSISTVKDVNVDEATNEFNKEKEDYEEEYNIQESTKKEKSEEFFDGKTEEEI